MRKCFESITGPDSNVFLDEPNYQVPLHLTLVLDKNLHIIPWEVTNSFSSAKIYRMPSFWHIKHERTSNGRSVSYVLNPSGDLKHTEQFFTERLSSHQDWNGIIGRAPNEQEFIESLSTSKLFLYFGHGGGDSYVNGSKIRQLGHTRTCAPSFLIGCSSGKIKPLGEFCPEGTFLNYLYAGCPTILVNLWDVTDKDIDRFTDVMFTRLGIYEDSYESNDLSSAVSSSRSSCLLKHINGAAPVVYGRQFKYCN